jgi:hypothetical protein
MTDIGKRASEISVGILSLKLPTVAEVPIGNDVGTFKTMEGVQLVSDSAKASLFNEFRAAGYRQFLIIRLGSGREWLSSRLFIFALMLQRMKGIRAVVFVDSSGDSQHFVGVATPDSIRWGLAKRQPWLEAAFASAYGDATVQFKTPPFSNKTLVSDFSGALDPDLAETIVRSFVGKLLLPAGGISNEAEWSQLGNTYEHATWLDSSTVRGVLGDHLWSETIVTELDNAEKVKLLLRKKSPYVAVVDQNGSFQSLVDRAKLLQDVSEHIS